MMQGQLAPVGGPIAIVVSCRPDPTGKEVCDQGRETGAFRVLGD